MSKPYSSVGLPGDWARLLLHDAVWVLLMALGLWISGFTCARVLAHRPDPAVAADRATAAIYQDSLARSRALTDTLVDRYLALHAQLDTMTNRAAATGRAVTRLTHGITIDTSAHVARDPGSRSAATAAPVDTTAMAVVMRAEDTTHYLIPKFIGDGYLALEAHVAALQEGWDTEKALRETAESRFVDDSTHRANEGRYADSTIAAQGREVAALEHEGHPVCGWRCGAVSTLGVLAAIAYIVKGVIR